MRKDLLTTFHTIMSNDTFSKLDWIIIETTGLADPAPVIQTLYMDVECQRRMRIDSVITVVDAKHIQVHINTLNNLPAGDSSGAHGGIPEAVLQISMADRVLLNKIDLVADEIELKTIQSTISSINPSALIFPTLKCNIPLDKLLNIKAFDPIKNDALLRPENLSRPEKSIFVIRTDSDGKILIPDKKKKFTFNSKSRSIAAAAAAGNSSSAKTDEVIGAVVTVSLTTAEPLDLHSFNMWIASLLQSNGNDIYRMKGILSMHSYDRKFVAHGIHMMFDGQVGDTWQVSEERRSRLVFIGLNLNAEELEGKFMECLHANASRENTTTSVKVE